ncbi:hypothetical protein [Paludisphaera mucosa]|uniref:YcxB-like protein domain-containing protein n=1 Tax=Paludisphaera mucosa TaxID=3030827 RepID=A0ABT6FIT7_9BACT|nr:hypothetical protein [Paludisphaera mucosa]MDG3007493.1 hypothetical protein [Paludisphaera mucosa]
MDVREIPFVADPSRVVGWASFRFTEDEFVAATRAVTMAQLRWYGSRFWGILFFGFWHVLLLGGLYLIVRWARSGDGPDGPVSGWTAVEGLLATLVAGRILWVGFYGLHRRVRASYARFPFAGDEYAMALTPDRYITHSPLVDSSDDWAFLPGVVEFRDGFVLLNKSGAGGLWLPDHALHAPFNHPAAAALFRSKAPRYASSTGRPELGQIRRSRCGRLAECERQQATAVQRRDEDQPDEGPEPPGRGSCLSIRDDRQEGSTQREGRRPACGETERRSLEQDIRSRV